MAKRKSFWDKKRNQADAIDLVICKHLSGSLVVEDEFEIDEATGLKVRVFPEGYESTDEEERHFLLGQRVVDIEDFYKELGKKRLAYWLKSGYLKKDNRVKSLFWVTKKAAERFDLPKVMNCEFVEVA